MYRVKHVSFATLFVLECFYGGGFFERKFFEAKKDGEKSYIRTILLVLEKVPSGNGKLE